MSSPINSLTSGYLQSILSTALQTVGVSSHGAKSTNSTSGSLNGVGSLSQVSDNSQLSPFAQLMSTLQELQQSNPTQYQQVTQQIATNLQSAAQTATSEGNTTAASQLNQLSTDFSNASQSGQLPNIQDLAQAIGGGGHHHHGHHALAASSDSDSSSSSTSSTSTSQTLSQLLAAFQTSSATSGTQSNSLSPMNIILNTLSSAGITFSSAG